MCMPINTGIELIKERHYTPSALFKRFSHRRLYLGVCGVIFEMTKARFWAMM